MTYREKLEKLKNGTLEERERQQLEQEIERHEAISEYLFEEEIPELEQVLESGMDEIGEADNSEFVALVNRSIRSAFRKMGMMVLVIGLVLGVFLQAGLPKLVSLLYYDPSKPVGEDSNQMSLDMRVYSELFLPCRQKDTVRVDANGFGNYDICIRQNFSFNRVFTDVSGEISRGKLRLYDTNPIKLPTGNSFVWFQADMSRPLSEQDEQFNMCAAGKREYSIELLNELDENKLYIGYVSLDRMMEYEEFVAYTEANDMDVMWCAAKTYEPEGDFYRADNVGFAFSLSSSASLEWDEEKYPELVLWNLSRDEMEAGNPDQIEADMKTEPFMRQHFVSLLNYLADQEAFLSMVETNNMDAESLHRAAEYVAENGISVYGYATVMDREDALELCELDEVFEIYVTELQ